MDILSRRNLLMVLSVIIQVYCPMRLLIKMVLLVKQLYYSRKGSNSVNNPLYEATLSNYEWSAYDEIIDNLSVNWYLNDYLTVKGQFSVTKQYTSSERFYDPLSSKVSVYGTTDTKLQG